MSFKDWAELAFWLAVFLIGIFDRGADRPKSK